MKLVKINGTLILEAEVETLIELVLLALAKKLNLRYANLSSADLSYANLRSANLRSADLRSTDLSYVDLRYANLSYANLRSASLSSADLTEVSVNNFTSGYFQTPPEAGAFEAYKVASGVIVKLLIPAEAKRSSATARKCRASKAIVLGIEGQDEVVSNYSSSFVYKVGETVEVEDYDNDRWNECAPGIHFFMTREEAELW